MSGSVPLRPLVDVVRAEVARRLAEEQGGATLAKHGQAAV